MNTVRETLYMIRQNPGLAVVAALGDVVVATITTLVVLKLVGVL